MRLGGRIFEKWDSAEQWIQLHKNAGYRAAYCPVNADVSDTVLGSYVSAAEAADIVIAEVGAWSNPMHPDAEKRTQAIKYCETQLALAERIGAKCCVNIAGSRGESRNGPHELNYADETFDMVVELVRGFIDAVKPTRTFYCLEMMSWCIPDDAHTYQKLIQAIDRSAFAVHFDPVNIINNPQRYYENGRVIKETIDALGPHIKSVHVKDVIMASNHLVHIDECRPGTGTLDYATLFNGLEALNPEVPIMLEHLPNAEEYHLAAEHVRAVTSDLGLTV